MVKLDIYWANLGWIIEVETSRGVHSLVITSNFVLISCDTYFKYPVPVWVYNCKFDLKK